jgi:hypothetical protein
VNPAEANPRFIVLSPVEAMTPPSLRSSSVIVED